MKRLEYAQQILDSGDAFHNVIFSDECSVSLERYRRTCYRKVDEPFKRKPKPKHSLKVHVWEGISRKGATKVCIFDGIMVQNCTAVFWRQPFYHSSIRHYQTTDLCWIRILTYDKTSEGLLRGEWYKPVAYSPRESGFKSHGELLARTEILLRIESEVVKQTRTGWRNKGVLGWEGDGREIR